MEEKQTLAVGEVNREEESEVGAKKGSERPFEVTLAVLYSLAFI